MRYCLYKNHAIIVEACKQLKDDGIDNYKVIFTFEANESKTAKKISDYIVTNDLPIELIGRLNRDQVMDLYQSAVLVFPSRIETDAMPLLECAISGGVAIASDLPYAHDCLDSYKKRIFCDSNNYKEWSSVMKKMIMNEIICYPEPINNVKNNNMTRLELIIEVVKKKTD